MASPTRTLKRRRTALAIAFALLAHLAAFLALGWRVPRLVMPEVAETPPDLEVSLVRLARAASAPAPPAAAHARAAPTRAPASATAAPAAPIATPAPSATSAGAVAAGPADCEPEDLALLNDAEKARCRSQIDADQGRRLAREAEARRARQFAGTKIVPRIDNIPAQKRAYYDAVAQAYDQQAHGPPMAGRTPGGACGLGGKAKGGPGSLSIGPCTFWLGQGFLTEESGVSPP